MQPNEHLTTVETLSQPAGLDELQTYLGTAGGPLTPDQLSALGEMLQSELSSPQQMGNIDIRVGPTRLGGGAAAFPIRGLVTIDPKMVNNPFPLAHELGHVKSIRESGDLYKMLQGASRGMLASNSITIPAVIAIAALLRKNPIVARKLLNVAAGVTAVGAIPTVVEETSATLDALKHVPEHLRNTSMAINNIGGYAVSGAVPPLAFLLAKKLL